MNTAIRTATCLGALLALASCSSDVDGDPNPAPPAELEGVTIEMTGHWECVESTLVETNYELAEGLEVGDTLVIEADLLIRDLEGTSYRRADIEDYFDTATDWYLNRADGTSLSYGFGWNFLLPGNADVFDYYQIGLRLWPTESGELIGYQTTIWQFASDYPRHEWTYRVRMQRRPAAQPVEATLSSEASRWIDARQPMPE